MSWQDVIRGMPIFPALIGGELEPYPFISGYGMLRRMTHLGRLMGVELTAVGIRNRVATDVLTATQKPGAVKQGLLRALLLQDTHVGRFWSPEAWSPIDTHRALENQRLPLKDCPQCATHGYHTALFQLPSVDRCPWHNEKLYSTCPKCRRTCWAVFHSDLRLGRCSCEHDTFQVRTASVEMWQFPSAEADAWASQYLDWAAEERKKRVLVLPPLHSNWTAGYATLADMPQDHLVATENPSAEIEVFSGDGEDPSEGEFWGWCLLGGERQLTFAPLPGTMHGRLAQAARDAIAALPADTPTLLQLTSLDGFDGSRTPNRNLVDQPEILFAPHGLSNERTTWLNISAVDPVGAWFCGQILDVAVRRLPKVDDESGKRSFQAAQSQSLDRISGRRHLARALEATLTRSYSQGLERVLKTMRPSSEPAPQKWVLPTAEIVIENEAVQSVRLCWTATPPPRARRPVDTPPPVSRPTGAKKPSSKTRNASGRRTRARRNASPRK